ncbi:MAG TPA: YicC/YloC family endoribonuclease [Cyclobacteriaceae bacterium]|nr:YicC/YloC family endoribonuclease [Cyclobacteriaceae bacterium]
MIKSMTGYGIGHIENEEATVVVEVKSLNSKFLDLSIKSPRQFADRELEIRNLVAEKLERGKVNVGIEYVPKAGNELPVSINEGLFQSYYNKYSTLAAAVGADKADLFKLAIQSPNVSTPNPSGGTGGEGWEAVRAALMDALANCNQFREDEGNTLYHRFEENIQILEQGLEQVKSEEPRRRKKIQERIRNNFSEWLDENSFDQNRFEQELIYYFEKLDITEEIVRLGTHLDYFRESLKGGSGQGKKLGFISQELGREINTIGSKANDAVIQRHVILMKDELEKIKEQALNIL